MKFKPLMINVDNVNIRTQAMCTCIHFQMLSKVYTSASVHCTVLAQACEDTGHSVDEDVASKMCFVCVSWRERCK